MLTFNFCQLKYHYLAPVGNRTMNSSLQSYDLARLFLYTEPSISGGESLVYQEKEELRGECDSAQSSVDMSDSLSVVSWPDECGDSQDM